MLVDLAMPGMPGLDLIPLLRLRRPNLRIVAMTLLDTAAYRTAALAAGADAFVSTSALVNELVPAIRSVARDGPVAVISRNRGVP